VLGAVRHGSRPQAAPRTSSLLKQVAPVFDSQVKKRTTRYVRDAVQHARYKACTRVLALKRSSSEESARTRGRATSIRSSSRQPERDRAIQPLAGAASAPRSPNTRKPRRERQDENARRRPRAPAQLLGDGTMPRSASSAITRSHTALRHLRASPRTRSGVGWGGRIHLNRRRQRPSALPVSPALRA